MMETVASAVLLYMAVLAAVTAAALILLAGRQTVDLLEVQMPPTRLVEGGRGGQQARRARQERNRCAVAALEAGAGVRLRQPQPVQAVLAALAAAGEEAAAPHPTVSTPVLVALAAQATPASTLGEVST
jgi:hypothetical protein